jgi:hypothetical protein
MTYLIYTITHKETGHRDDERRRVRYDPIFTLEGPGAITLPGGPKRSSRPGPGGPVGAKP